MLTLEEQAYNFETMRHIERVRNLLGKLIADLLERAAKHDQSKLEPPEVTILAKAKPLGPMTYNSSEYKAGLLFVEEALQHHYAKNRHHPQHFKDGVNDMTLLDLLEMIVDWKASGERHHNGNLLKSISENRERFGLSDQLAKIFNNTAHMMDQL